MAVGKGLFLDRSGGSILTISKAIACVLTHAFIGQYNTSAERFFDDAESGCRDYPHPVSLATAREYSAFRDVLNEAHKIDATQRADPSDTGLWNRPRFQHVPVVYQKVNEGLVAFAEVLGALKPASGFNQAFPLQLVEDDLLVSGGGECIQG